MVHPVPKFTPPFNSTLLNARVPEVVPLPEKTTFSLEDVNVPPVFVIAPPPLIVMVLEVPSPAVNVPLSNVNEASVMSPSKLTSPFNVTSAPEFGITPATQEPEEFHVVGFATLS